MGGKSKLEIDYEDRVACSAPGKQALSKPHHGTRSMVVEHEQASLLEDLLANGLVQESTAVHIPRIDLAAVVGVTEVNS